MPLGSMLSKSTAMLRESKEVLRSDDSDVVTINAISQQFAQAKAAWAAEEKSLQQQIRGALSLCLVVELFCS